MSRIGPNMNNFDDYWKLNGILMDTVLHRRNVQFNGVILIIDCCDYPAWFAYRMISPIFVRNSYNNFYSPIPIRMKKIVLLNLPLIGAAFYKLLRPFLSHKLRQRVVMLGSDWSTLCDHVPKELLPEEYGGTAGPMEQHEDAFLNEVLAFNEYIAEDSKYGFQ